MTHGIKRIDDLKIFNIVSPKYKSILISFVNLFVLYLRRFINSIHVSIILRVMAYWAINSRVKLYPLARVQVN